MENTEITIPEELQQICREMAQVAQKHKLFEFSGHFQPRNGWGGKVSFSWKAGRHNEDSDEINITSEFYVYTKVRTPNTGEPIK